MAAAGFYHTGPDDEVMSPFMMKEIGGWEEDDDPRVEVLFSLVSHAFMLYELCCMKYEIF